MSAPDNEPYVPFWKTEDPVVLNRRHEDAEAAADYDREREERLCEHGPSLEELAVKDGWFR